MSEKTPIPDAGIVAIQIDNGDETVDAAFDLASWQVNGMEKAPNLDSLFSRDVIAAAKNFIPTTQVIMGYVALNSEVHLNFRHRPPIFMGLNPACIVVCTIVFAAAMAICGALFAGGITIPAGIRLIRR